MAGANGKTRENIEDNDKLNPGDHVKVKTYITFWVIFWKTIFHHGIVVKEAGRTAKVISLTCVNKKDGAEGADSKILSQNLGSFKGENPIVRINYKSPPYTGQEVQERALNLLKNPNQFGNYNWLRNNCEHFGTFCKTGKGTSDQTRM